MTILAKNLSVIELKNKLLAKSLNNYQTTKDVEIVISKKDIPVVKFKNLFLSSKYNPERDALTLYENIKNKEANYIFVFGLPNTSISEIFGNPSENQKIIIFEPSLDILKSILSSYDFSSFFKNENILIFSNLDNLDNFLQANLIPGETMEFAINSSYKTLFIEEIKNFVNIIKNVESMKSVHASTLISYGPEFARQNINNIFNINKSAPINTMHNRFNKIPAIIISPGPSLAKNIKYLKKLKHKAIIFSTAPALSVLKKWNIKPDFVNAIETQNFSYQINKFEDFLDETYLILLSQCHKDFFKIKCRGIFSYFTAGEKSGIYLSEKSPIFNKGIFASGGSVSTDAFFAAYFFGCSPIVVVGQDLAISGNNNYSMFTLEEDAKISTQGQNVTVSPSKVRAKELSKSKKAFFSGGPKKQIVETNGLFQKKIKSKTDYFTFKAWFENTARNVMGRELINSTEGGAFIEGFKHLPLSKVTKNIIESGKEFTIEEIDKVFKTFKPAKQLEVLNFLKSEKLAYKNIKSFAQKLLENLSKAASLEKKGRTDEASYQFNKAFKKQEDFSKKIDKLKILEAFLEEDLLRMELIKRNLKKLSKEVIVEGNIHFLKKTIDATEKLIKIVDDTLNLEN